MFLSVIAIKIEEREWAARTSVYFFGDLFIITNQGDPIFLFFTCPVLS
jgi:hypothetical protein